ncbi:MAG: hypothetical protein GC156_07945 [Actinomycetales bacterium]|nr:hypothetical protein [Actinomycetales bacterium]
MSGTGAQAPSPYPQKPERLPRDPAARAAVIAAHEAALQRGDAGYRDPATGLFVMTARYLADRGYCCGSGCRHCPYP